MTASPAIPETKPVQHTPASSYTVGPGSDSVSRLSEDSDDSSPGLTKPTPTGEIPRTQVPNKILAFIAVNSLLTKLII